jgi:polyhydroxyalkanoate synthesis repressor PhaR
MGTLMIKRYPNRKLYDTESKQYVTLNGIAELIRDGHEVQVVDHMSNEDLTAVTLTQIILEQEKKQGGFLPTAVLRGLVQSGGETLNAIRRNLSLPLELLRHVDEEIERRLHALMSQGELAREEGLRLRDKLLSPTGLWPEGLFSSEQEVETALKERGVPTRQEFDSLNAQLDDLSAKLDALIDENSQPPASQS